MNRVRCGECGKIYNYDEDGFCPKCGAFNQPFRHPGAMRVDGISEQGHADSFLHQEFHREEKERRISGMTKRIVVRRPAEAAREGRVSAAPYRTDAPSAQTKKEKQKAQDPKQKVLRIAGWIVALSVLFNLVASCQALLFWH